LKKNDTSSSKKITEQYVKKATKAGTHNTKTGTFTQVAETMP
jgi:hypothetical protein